MSMDSFGYGNSSHLSGKDVGLYVILPITVTLLVIGLVVWLSFYCVNRMYKKQNLANNGDATDEYRRRHSKSLWLLWILTILNFIGIIIAVILVAIGVSVLKSKISHPPSQQARNIPIGSILQLDYNGTVWSEDYSFDENIDIPKATYQPSTQLQIHSFDVANHWSQPDSSLQGKTTLWAPVLKCQNANDSVIANATRRFGRDVSHKDTFFTSYAAWVPGDQFATQWLPALQGDPFSAPIKTIDNQSPDTKRLFVMTNSGDTHKVVDDGVHGPLGSVNVTECRLGNASLTVNFDDVSTEVSSWSLPFTHGEVTETTANELASYTALMSAFDAILVGSLRVYGSSKEVNYLPFNPPWKNLNIDWTRTETVQKGLEDFFQNITISLLSDPSFSKTVAQ